MALAALACIITFSSCSSDEDPVAKSSGIVGEWIQAFRTDQGYGEYAQTVISYYIAKFNANNTGTQVVYYVYFRDFDTDNRTVTDITKKTDEFKYTIKDNQITIDDGATDVDPMTLSFSVGQDGTTLTMWRNNNTQYYEKINDEWRQDIDVLEKTWQEVQNNKQ